MTLRYGLDIDLADQHPTGKPEHLHLIAAIVGDKGSAGTATTGALYKETDVTNVGSLYTAASTLGLGIHLFENIEDITLVILPTAAATGVPTNAEMDKLLAAQNELALPRHPDLIVAPTIANAAATASAPLAHLKSVAKSMRAKINVNAFATTDANAKTWATNNLSVPSGDIQRVRATPNTFAGPDGTAIPASLLLGAMTALVQNNELGEDVMNRDLPRITSASPAYSFDMEDASTQGQDLANAYLTPIVLIGGSYRFWGRQVAAGDLGDAGFQWVLDDVVRGLKTFFANYLGRNQLPGDLVLQASIFNDRLRHRVDTGQLTDAICIPDPRYGNGSGLDTHTNTGYVLLALQRTPYGGKFVFSLDTNTGAVAAVQGI